MITIAGVWEDGWDLTIPGQENLWRFVARAFGAGVKMSADSRELARTISEYRDEGFEIVFFDENGDVELANLEHPEQALYVFGRANFDLGALAAPGDVSVRIETPVPHGLMWGHQAAAIALYDRGDEAWL